MKFFKILTFFVIVYLLSVFTAYFSMIDYKDTVSASCLECSLIRDVFVFPLFSSVILTILYIFLKKIIEKKIVLSIITAILFLALSCLNNYYIFVDRVSSWSSFTLQGEIAGIISNSYLYLIISAFIVYISAMKLNVKAHDDIQLRK